MRSDAHANQRKIVEAATRLLAEQGLDAELRDIAHEAGVGVGTVYRCVGNRDQVIETIARAAFARFAESFAEAEAGEGGVDGLRRLIEALYRTRATYGWALMALIGGGELLEDARALDPMRRLARLYERARDRGDLRTDIEPEVAAALILGSLAPWASQQLGADTDAPAAAAAALAPFRTRGEAAATRETDA